MFSNTYVFLSFWCVDVQARKLFLEKHVSRQVPRLRLKEGKVWRAKRAICNDIRKLHGVGPLTGRNLWSFMSLGVRGNLVPDNNSWGVVGVGAREAVNLLNNWPPTLLKESPSQDAADFFVIEVAKIQYEFLSLPDLAPLPGDSPLVSAAKSLVRDEASTIESMEFMLCEFCKVVKWVYTRKQQYVMGFWKKTVESWKDDRLR